MRRNKCVCLVSLQLEAAQNKPKGPCEVWRVEVHLAGHFGGLGHGLVHVAVHGAVRVGASALVLDRVAAAAIALIGM